MSAKSTPAHYPDHAEFGRHLHEVQPGRWRLFDPIPRKDPK